jgi:hypothetical protein
MYYLRVGSDGPMSLIPTAVQCIVYLWLSNSSRRLYLRLFGVTALTTETNLIQQATTIDTEQEKESEEIGENTILRNLLDRINQCAT